jgi:hypothetical protein
MEWKLIEGSVDKPFFEQNPDLAYFSVIKRLIKKFNKSNAGKIMWAVYMTEDIEGAFYGRPIEEKRSEVQSNFLQDVDNFDWEDGTVQKVVEEYPKIAMPPKKRRYKRLQDIFDLMITDLETGGDENGKSKYSTNDLKNLQAVLTKAEDEWEKESDKLSSERGRQKSNDTFWGSK